MKVCCGFGHRVVYADLEGALRAAVEAAIERGCELFLTGAMGMFDRMFAFAVREAKRSHPNIRLICVLPYPTAALERDRAYYAADFDDVWIPPELLNMHPKGAIGARNRRMIDRSDLVLFYVKNRFGGAYQALQYAKRADKPLILL